MSDRPPGPSVRLKLTLTYAGFVVVVAVAVFALGFLVLRFVPEGNLQVQGGGFAPRRVDLVEVWIRYAWWTLLGLSVIGLGGGWIVAGWVLRPLTRITDAARRAGDGSFTHRVALPGRRDELTDLADTFDDMLDRVGRTLDEQRRFAANASHELRTPHAVMRTMLEVAQADPDGRDVEVLIGRLSEMNERSIRLTEALLRLSRVAQGTPFDRLPVTLDAVVGDVVAAQRAQTQAHGIETSTALAPALTAGDETLLTQLVDNLVRNAVVHNRADAGRIHVETGTVGGHVVLTVANTGAPLDPATIATLAEPFVRGAGRTRGGAEDGQGLGLAIVAAIVRAHGGRLELRALGEGGLRVDVTLPAAA